MAIKYICDICDNEMKKFREEGGHFKISEVMTAIFQGKTQPQMRVAEYIMCLDCAEKLRKELDKLKNAKK